jgi:hypothetical protein
MKLNFAQRLCAVLFAIAMTSAPATAQTMGLLDGPGHRPFEPHRTSDGKIKRGLHNEIQTGYWSGYAVTAAAPYTSASATWQIPTDTYVPESGDAGTDYVGAWVGIGGYGDSTLIQLGTMGWVTHWGVTNYYVWYELYPAVGQTIPYNVQPGDIITASLQCTAACSPAAVQTWVLTMTDARAGWTWTHSFQYQSSMASAEWIVEAPWDQFGETPLANYGKITFDPVYANGANPNLTLAANAIQMSDPWGETSNPSAAVNGNVFSTCWGLAPSFTLCTAGSFTTPSPPPTASLSAYPATISPGQASTLTWSSANASSCTEGGFTGSGTAGKAVVYPTVTTSYSVTCTGAGGSATAMATVTVKSPKICLYYGSLCYVQW